MPAEVIQLLRAQPVRTPIGHTIRTGERSYRQLETLHPEVRLPDFDRSFMKKDLQLIARATGGRRLVSCQNRECCPRGLNSMLDKPRAHIAYQRFHSMEGLFKTPDIHRAQHFLDNEMRNAERKARDLSRLDTGDDKVNKALAAGRKRIDTMARMFETLTELDLAAPPPLARCSVPAVAGGMRTL